jgi:hypothetical protein
MTVSNQEALKVVCDCAYSALRTEDAALGGRSIQKFGSETPAVSPEIFCGNERFLQYIVGRAVYIDTDWAVKFEEDRHDVVVYLDSAENPRRLVVEIKVWRSSSGEPELAAISDDLTKLRAATVRGDAALSLIVTVQPSGQCKDNIKFLLEKLSLSERNLVAYLRSPMVCQQKGGEAVELAVIGLIP